MDLWDRLFKVNLSDGDAGISVDGFGAAVRRYAAGDYTAQQIADNMLDAQGVAIPGAQLQQATILTDIIDGITDANPVIETALKINKAEQMFDAMRMAELGWINKTQALALVSIP